MSSIKLGNLDTRMVVTIKNLLYTNVYNKVNSFDCTSEDFVEALNSGIRDKVVLAVKDYYSFMDSVDVELTDEELFQLYKTAV